MNKKITITVLGLIIVGFSIYTFIFQMSYNNAIKSLEIKINESSKISYSLGIVDSLIHIVQKNSSKQKWDELKDSISKEFECDIKTIYPNFPDNKRIIIDSVNQLINKIDLQFKNNDIGLSNSIYYIRVYELELQNYYLKLQNYQIRKYIDDKKNIKVIRMLSIGLLLLGLVILIWINKEKLKLH